MHSRYTHMLESESQKEKKTLHFHSRTKPNLDAKKPEIITSLLSYLQDLDPCPLIYLMRY